MKNLKNSIVGGVIGTLVIGGGIIYYFDPQIAGNVFSNDQLTNETSSIIVDSSVIQQINDTSSDALASDQPLTLDKLPAKTSSKQKASSKNNSSTSALAVQNDEIQNVDQDNFSNSSTSFVANSARENIPAVDCRIPNIQTSVISRKIIFNEIAWMGSVSSSNEEWIEIKNISGGDIDLSDWELINSSGKIKKVFSAGDVISLGGLVLLSRSVGNNTTNTKTYSGTLSNAGDILIVLDPQCNISDVLDASSGWPAGNNITKQTLERDVDGIGWHTSVSVSGTPGAQNSTIASPGLQSPSQSSGSVSPPSQGTQNIVFIPFVASTTTSTSNDPIATNTLIGPAPTTIPVSNSNSEGHILISEVQISGASSTNDFVKLYNPTLISIDIGGWKLRKRSQTGADYSLKQFLSGSIVDPGQSFIWANAVGGFSEAIAANVSSTETLSADNSIALIDASGTIVDALAWGIGVGQYGEGLPLSVGPASGQVIVRRSDNGVLVDTANNNNDFILK